MRDKRTGTFVTISYVTKKNISFMAGCAIIVLLIDQLSKQWALAELAGGRTVNLIGDYLALHLTFNPGAAFSFLDNATWIFTLLGILFVLGLPIVLWRMAYKKNLIAWSVIWAGALGNLIDRLVREPGFGRGHVVDFIQYSDWFIGNIADIALVVGFIVIIIAELRGANATEHSEGK